MLDLAQMSDAELDEQHAAITAEMHRRQILANAPARVEAVQAQAEVEVDAIATDYLTARDGPAGTDEPAEWVDPSSPGGMPYPKGWIITRGGVVYVSQIPANVWPPGDPTDPQTGRWWAPQDDDADPDEWAPWTDYGTGDERTYETVWYRCVQGHHSQPGWEPPAVPALWEGITVDPVPGDPDPPEGEEPSDPDPPGDDRPAGYVGPWDANTRYEVDDVVSDQGHYWRAKIAHGAEYQGTWRPPAHAVWTDLGPLEDA